MNDEYGQDIGEFYEVDWDNIQDIEGLRVVLKAMGLLVNNKSPHFVKAANYLKPDPIKYGSEVSQDD